jgi:hypothetical protein
MDHHPNNNTNHPSDGMAHDNNGAVSYDLTHYRVYHAVYALLGGTGVRNAIYLHNGPESANPMGHLFQVMGSRSTGPMVFKDRFCRHPFRSPEGRRMTHVGWVLQDDCVERIRDVCAGVLPPPQLPAGSHEPRGGCNEWVEEAIAALFSAGVLQQLRLSDQGTTIFR